MSRTRCRTQTKFSSLIVLALSALPGCSSVGDFGRLQQEVVTDDIHAWVGWDAARHAGAPISNYNLTEDEQALRDLAFALIEPPYDRIRWDAIVYEYGTKRGFRPALWTLGPAVYYGYLQAAGYRSSTGRYNKLIDDIRNDTVRIGPFFDLAQRVLDLDRRREMSLKYVADLSPADRANARARIGENILTIAWVERSLAFRAASYRFALEHLVVAEPERVAADADVTLTQLQQLIAANQLVPVPHFAPVPVNVAAQGALVAKD
ncbi:MAG TPA: hypothetical protein VNU65_14005 [Xanthobacteraceae bacterium]|nr:hypothetical protein [Xanthobacteraceae bacterium]